MSTGSLSLLTINLLSGAANWNERLPLLADGLKSLAPDLIAVQEVTLEADSARQAAGNAANRLADEIGYAHCSLTPQTGRMLGNEAIAILSHLPFEDQDWIGLGGQGRVVQRVTVQVAGRPVVVANTHLFWQPGDSRERLSQVERISGWLAQIPGRPPCLVCGDFNGTPETAAIRRIKQEFASAYAAVHGAEPERTFPTPLKRSRLAMLLGVWDLLGYVRPQRFKLSLTSTLDYIFVDRRLRVIDCRLVLDQPAPSDPGLYPSDHYGLMAKVELNDSVSSVESVSK